MGHCGSSSGEDGRVRLGGLPDAVGIGRSVRHLERVSDAVAAAGAADARRLAADPQLDVRLPRLGVGRPHGHAGDVVQLGLLSGRGAAAAGAPAAAGRRRRRQTLAPLLRPDARRSQPHRRRRQSSQRLSILVHFSSNSVQQKVQKWSEKFSTLLSPIPIYIDSLKLL